MIIPTLAILILAPPQITHAAEKTSNSTGGFISFSSPTAKGASDANTNNKGMHYSKPSHIPIARPSKATDKQEASRAESPYGRDKDSADKIWEKYRALAGGQDSAPKAATIPVKKVKKVKVKTQGQPASATGIAGIISQYQANKQKRSQMRSLTIAKPAMEKPGDKKPDTPEETDEE